MKRHLRKNFTNGKKGRERWEQTAKCAYLIRRIAIKYSSLLFFNSTYSSSPIKKCNILAISMDSHQEWEAGNFLIYTPVWFQTKSYILPCWARNRNEHFTRAACVHATRAWTATGSGLSFSFIDSYPLHLAQWQLIFPGRDKNKR